MKTFFNKSAAQEAVPEEWKKLGKWIWKWAEQLKKLSSCSTGIWAESSHDEWSLCSHGVVLETDEISIGIETAHRVAGHAGMDLHIIPVTSIVEEFPKWLDEVCSGPAAMIYLSPGQWMGGRDIDDFLEGQSKGCEDEQACQAFREHLISDMIEKVRGRPIVIVTCTSSVQMLHLAMRKVRLFDRRIRIPSLTKEALVEEFIQNVGQDNLGSSFHCHSKLGDLLRYEYRDSRRRDLACNALRRLAWSENRQVEFADLLHFAAFGTGEFDSIVTSEHRRWSTAVHEAGHAVIAHLDSRLREPPAMSSVWPAGDSLGVVVPNASAHEQQSNDLSWQDVMHRIRVNLAGRAAESVLLEARDISAAGSSSDLHRAKTLAYQIIAEWGLPTDIQDIDSAAENLAVVTGETSASESARFEAKVAQLLSTQFLSTVRLLEAHKPYLLSVATALHERWVLFHEDFEQIFNASTSNHSLASVNVIRPEHVQ